jgi:hypothetical protein
MDSDRVRFYVVRVGNGYAVWEMTAIAMAAKTDADPTLASRLDRAPFSTREDAEHRRALLESRPNF